jgi:hypothetical protein
MKCLIRSAMGWECDDEYGHAGMMHSNSGDGFYAPQHDEKHKARQAEVSKASWQQAVPSDEGGG